MVESEQELILLREENAKLRSCCDGEKRRVRDLEERLINAESANNSLQRKIHASQNAKVALENEVSTYKNLSCIGAHI